MDHRLTISMLAAQDAELKKFARKCRMSAATTGRLAVDHLIKIVERGSTASGETATVKDVLQQLQSNKRRKRNHTQQRTQT